MKNIPAYLIWMAASLGLTALWVALSRKKREGTKRALLQGLLFAVLGGMLGLAGARIAWLLMRINTLSLQRMDSWFWPIDVNELSYYGGVAGVCLAAWCVAKVTHAETRAFLREFAPAGAFLAALARFGEGFLGYLGVGKYLEEPLPFPLAVRFTWDGGWFEDYLAVFMLEGIFSLIACAVALKHREEPDRFRHTLFYLCLPQIALESLRMQSISWLFVRAEQLIPFLYCLGVSWWLGHRSRSLGAKRWLPVGAGLLVSGVVIAGEFALDGKLRWGEARIPALLIYGVYALLLILWAVAEHRAHQNI